MSADDLYAYVTADEPPMTLTAAGLLTRGRRRHRLRMLGTFGGGGALAVAMVMFLVQLPATPPAPALSTEAACLAAFFLSMPRREPPSLRRAWPSS